MTKEVLLDFKFLQKLHDRSDFDCGNLLKRSGQELRCNGKVIGYDNAHDYHHKHYYGEILPVEDFESYENIVERFENEIKEYIK